MAAGTRPWQGTTLGVLDILLVVLFFFLSIIFFFFMAVSYGVQTGVSTLSNTSIPVVIAQTSLENANVSEAVTNENANENINENAAALIDPSKIPALINQEIDKNVVDMMEKLSLPAEFRDNLAKVGLAGIIGFVSGFSLVIALFMLSIGIFYIFMARGAFKGRKWSPIISIIFSAMGLLGTLSGMQYGVNYFGLAMNGFVLYCGIMCVQHPYYNPVKTELI